MGVRFRAVSWAPWQPSGPSNKARHNRPPRQNHRTLVRAQLRCVASTSVTAVVPPGLFTCATTVTYCYRSHSRAHACAVGAALIATAQEIRAFQRVGHTVEVRRARARLDTRVDARRVAKGATAVENALASASGGSFGTLGAIVEAVLKRPVVEEAIAAFGGEPRQPAGPTAMDNVKAFVQGLPRKTENDWFKHMLAAGLVRGGLPTDMPSLRQLTAGCGVDRRVLADELRSQRELRLSETDTKAFCVMRGPMSRAPRSDKLSDRIVQLASVRATSARMCSCFVIGCVGVRRNVPPAAAVPSSTGVVALGTRDQD